MIVLLAALSPARAEHTFFDEKVLPILENRCYRCHGGEDTLKGDFRLTSREGLLHGGALGPAYDEDHPEQSFLLEAIGYEHAEIQMPPKGKLPAAERAVLRKWILEGASYNPAREIRGHLVERGNHIQKEDFEYWAYRPVERPPVPSGTAHSHPVDAFLARERGDIPVNPRADRETLIRRITYDLIGLPPTPEEVRRFVEDPRQHEQAWNALIEDLLGRPQHGEKWARHWLDLVRYAESNGFERDKPKPHIWQYRDYVVRAFNRDKPYDRFIVEQLAGDEVDDPTFDSLAATGYHRLMQWDDEPADRKQHVYDVLADNVAVTAETFLGTTIGCARCHDHKFDHKADPFTQRDYYSFMAFFHEITPYKTPGTILPWAKADEAAAFETRRRKEVSRRKEELAAVEGKLRDWLRRHDRLRSAKAADRNGDVLVPKASESKVTWDYTVSRPAPDWNSVGFRDKSWLRTYRGGFGTRGTPGAVVHNVWDTGDIWLRTAFGLRDLPDTLFLEIHHGEDVEVYLNGVEIYRAKGYLTGYETIPLDEDALDALQTGRNSLAIHCRQTGGGQFIDASLRSRDSPSSSLEEALEKGGKQLARQIRDDVGRDLVKDREQLRNEIAGWREKRAGTPLNVVTEFGRDPRPMHVHLRGSAHALGDEVEPAFPAVLHERFEPKPARIPHSYRTEDSSGRRRALAEWIASPENPLTARVLVNRLWQHHFGRGLVPTTSDFGELGEPPTHPDLLDWLAAEFVARGWSLKAMHRLLLRSEAYQRSSAPMPEALEADLDNRTFWRYDMRRLTAEEIRDSILAVSGNLHPRVGGPWVTPPLPRAVLATASRPGKNWPTMSGPEAHRRSLYVHVKRSLREPLLVSFDQADTDNHCAVRFATTVPTQALGMLNSEFTAAQSREFARRIRAQAETRGERVRFGLELALQRPPSEAEVREITTLLRDLEKTGLSADAALERFALLTFNLNEFIYLD